MFLEEVMDFHIGIGLLVAAVFLHEIVLPIELEFFSVRGGKSYLYRARGTYA